MDKITLLDGKEYEVKDLIKKMDDDSFYYGFCGRNMLSSSAIKDLLNGTYFDNDTELPKRTKDAFKQGRLLHMSLLEKDKLNEVAVIAECKTRGSKIYKDLILEHDENIVFTRNQFDKAEAMISNLVEQRPELSSDNCVNEYSGLAVISGIPFRGKADRIKVGEYIVDLKTTSRLSHFTESAMNYDYDIQLYIYCVMFNIKPNMFFWLALDKRTGESEYFVGSDALYWLGKSKVDKALKIFTDTIDGKG